MMYGHQSTSQYGQNGTFSGRGHKERGHNRRGYKGREHTERGIKDHITDGGITDRGITDLGITDGGITDGGIKDRDITDGGITDGGIKTLTRIKFPPPQPNNKDSKNSSTAKNRVLDLKCLFTKRIVGCEIR